jgi:hypothetical protein
MNRLFKFVLIVGALSSIGIYVILQPLGTSESPAWSKKFFAYGLDYFRVFRSPAVRI